MLYKTTMLRRQIIRFHHLLFCLVLLATTISYHVAAALTPPKKPSSSSPTTTSSSSSSSSSSASKTPPPPPPNLTPDDRQARMLEKMGYTWNGKAWTRGDAAAYHQQRATARSSNRFVRFVDSSSSSSHGNPISTPSSVAAAKRLEFILTNARKNVMSSTMTKKALARDRDFKNFCQKKYARYIWLGTELTALLVLLQVQISPPLGAYDSSYSEYFLESATTATTTLISVDLALEVQKFLDHPEGVLVAGVLAGVILSTCRAISRQLLPGVEEPDGKLIRALADTIAEDSIAIPAANHVRYDSNSIWRYVAFLGESIAAINVSIFMNGFIQPLLLQTISSASKLNTLPMGDESPSSSMILPSATLLAAFLTAVPATIRTYQNMAKEPWDGIPAECEAIVRSKPTVGAYFNMKHQSTRQQQGVGNRDAVDPIQATECFQQLADGWLDKFQGSADGASWKSPTCAFAGSLACAVAYQFSGGCLLAAILARIVAAGDTYLIGDEQESCRISVLLQESSTTTSGD